MEEIHPACATLQAIIRERTRDYGMTFGFIKKTTTVHGVPDERILVKELVHGPSHAVFFQQV